MALNLTTALIIGGILGVILAFVRDIVDARIQSERDVQRVTDVPVVGRVTEPELQRRRWWFGARRNESEDLAKELRTNFQHLQAARKLHTVVFISARDDRSTLLAVTSLGSELAHAGIRTLVIDGDLRRPSLAAWYGVTALGGLSSILLGQATWQEVVHRRGRLRLSLLPGGPLLRDLSTLFQPTTVATLISEVAASYDVVLIKAPPVLRVADGLLFSQLADGVIVVADGKTMTRGELAEELHTLGVADAKVLGVVLTA